MKTGEMNKQLKLIYDRVSIRVFQPKKVENHLIEELLNAGITAPTSGNMQPWEFIVIKDDAQKREIVTCTYFAYFSNGASYQNWIGNAGVIIVACANLKRTQARYGEDGKEWAQIDTAACIENILIAAPAFGLAGCWVGGFNEEKLKGMLNIPSYVKPIGMLPIGYPKEFAERKNRMPLKWMTHDGMYNIPYFKDEQ